MRRDRDSEGLECPFFESDQLEMQRFEEPVEHVSACLPRVARPVLDPVRPERGEVAKRKPEWNREPSQRCTQCEDGRSDLAVVQRLRTVSAVALQLVVNQLADGDGDLDIRPTIYRAPADLVDHHLIEDQRGPRCVPWVGVGRWYVHHLGKEVRCSHDSHDLIGGRHSQAPWTLPRSSLSTSHPNALLTKPRVHRPCIYAQQLADHGE